MVANCCLLQAEELRSSASNALLSNALQVEEVVSNGVIGDGMLKVSHCPKGEIGEDVTDQSSMRKDGTFGMESGAGAGQASFVCSRAEGTCAAAMGERGSHSNTGAGCWLKCSNEKALKSCTTQKEGDLESIME